MVSILSRKLNLSSLWRTTSLASANLSTQHDLKVTDWTPIYKLPIIRLAVALNKLKLYQMGFTALALPCTYALESVSQLPAGSFIAFAALGITGIGTLFISSYFTQNLIGFIYTNATKARFKISYVDFWGKRQDIELDHDEIAPPTGHMKLGLVYDVKTNKKSFKLLRRYGQVLEPNVFSYFFGE